MSGVDETRQRVDSVTATLQAGGTAYLRLLTGSQAGSWRAVAFSGIEIGRAGAPPSESIEQLLLDDPWVSRRHLRLRHRGRWQLTDLGGRNRTYIEGKQLEQDATVELTDGAVIRLGDTLLLFRESAPPPPSKPSEEAVFPGCSSAAFAVRRRIQQLAHGGGHVLILGETGTGKERVARAFGDSDRPFVPQNCAELTRDLARSELFGHLRGAFSGATDDRKGLVEIAKRGALFLDEIGELVLDVQGELLRFLEDGNYRPVGANDLKHSNARIVAATNVDLEAAVRAGRFRRDLLARLRASNPPLELPALRERREDLLDWAARFLLEALAEHGTVPPSPEPWNGGVAECLLLYPWPSNLRELRGTMRGLAIAGLGFSARPEHLPLEVRENRMRLRSTGQSPPPPQEQPKPEPTKPQIEELLLASNGSVRAAATQLGIERRKLYRLCAKLGIDLDRYRANPNEEE